MEAKKICVIEDEPLISHAIRISAIGDTFKISSANNGEDGLDLIRAEKPDLVLLDLMMPKMDGFETMMAIRKDDELKHTKVIVLSNDSTEESKEKAMELGAVDYFVKATSDLSELAARIAKAVEENK